MDVMFSGKSIGFLDLDIVSWLLIFILLAQKFNNEIGNIYLLIVFREIMGDIYCFIHK